MYQTVLSQASFFQTLLKLDADLAAEARRAGCACGGKLHSAQYPRKPRGLPEDGGALKAGYSHRHSFCCANEGCRKRTTPPSLRFLGRRVYLGVVVTLLTALRHGVTAVRSAELRERVGVSRETLERWRRWWLEEFPQTPVWRALRGRVLPPPNPGLLPLTLLESFPLPSAEEQALAVLRVILPLTGGGVRRGS